jgi:hypothetical protein
MNRLETLTNTGESPPNQRGAPEASALSRERGGREPRISSRGARTAARRDRPERKPGDGTREPSRARAFGPRKWWEAAPCPGPGVTGKRPKSYLFGGFCGILRRGAHRHDRCRPPSEGASERTVPCAVSPPAGAAAPSSSSPSWLSWRRRPWRAPVPRGARADRPPAPDFPSKGDSSSGFRRCGCGWQVGRMAPAGRTAAASTRAVGAHLPRPRPTMAA